MLKIPRRKDELPKVSSKVSRSIFSVRKKDVYFNKRNALEVG